LALDKVTGIATISRLILSGPPCIDAISNQYQAYFGSAPI